MKKTLILIITLISITLSMSGCNSSSEPIDGGGTISAHDFMEESLVYDTNTNIVYICHDDVTYDNIYTLYLSENGLPYRYIDGELIEVSY